MRLSRARKRVAPAAATLALQRLLAASLPALLVAASGCKGGTNGTDAGFDSGPAPTDAGPPATDAGPPPPRVDTYIPSGYRATAPARLIGMGDSITAGAGATTGAATYLALLEMNDPGLWPDFEAEDLETLFGGPPPLFDVSVGGAVTADLMGDQIPTLETMLTYPAAGETLVVMTIAGNDIVQLVLNPGIAEQVLQEVNDNLRAVVGYFQDPARFPDGAWIYIANVYEPSDGVGQAAECFLGLYLPDALAGVEESNVRSRLLAEELGFSLVDMRGHFLGHGFNYDDPMNPYYVADDPTLWFASDCIHPVNRGHHEIRRLFMAAIDGRTF